MARTTKSVSFKKIKKHVFLPSKVRKTNLENQIFLTFQGKKKLVTKKTGNPIFLTYECKKNVAKNPKYVYTKILKLYFSHIPMTCKKNIPFFLHRSVRKNVITHGGRGYTSDRSRVSS